jgi:hypothetical protein
MKKLIIIFAMMTSACTTTARMSRADLNDFQIDCSRKQEQIEFLISQWPSDKDKFINAFVIRSSGGFIASNIDGTYKDRQSIESGSYTTQLRGLINDIRTSCPN